MFVNFKKYKWLPFLLVIFSLQGCGDKNDGGINIFTIDDDKQLGNQLEQQIASDPNQYPVLDPAKYPKAYEHLGNIVNTILTKGDSLNHVKDFDWSFKIIHNDSVLNAFAAPGGKIYVYTGIIKYLDSEDQLAGVLGHEIAHADRRHVTQEMTKIYGLQLLLDVVLGKNQGALSNIALSLASLKFSRGYEAEADNYSVVYLYPTDFDARGAARFFEKLLAAGQGSQTPVFLSDHPGDQSRVEAITKKWQQKGSKVGNTFTTDYQDFKNSLP